jgi:hypothetical protein
MKAKFVVALAIGVLFSTVFMAIPSMRDGTSSWASLELPGMVAAFFFWGAVSQSVFLGTVLMWAVNAVAYGLCALLVLSVLHMFDRRAAEY